MKPYQKIYEFGFMLIIHPSGVTDTKTIGDIENQISLLDNSIKDLQKQRKIEIADIAKISSKSRIKRFFIKRKVAKNGKTQT